MFVKPEFHLAAPFGEAERNRVFLNFSYLQKADFEMKGTIDFWVQTGVVTRFSETVSFEASINHLCRHRTSIFNGYVLNLNEAVGRIWFRRGGLEAGFGLGAYFNSSPSHDILLSFHIKKTDLFIPRLSFSGDFKWVNFDRFVHEADLAYSLLPGVEVIFASLKPHDLPRTMHFGFRFRSGSGDGKWFDGFQASAGVFPFYENYKLTVDGRCRLIPYENPSSRLFFDVAFESPILTGTGFWSAFFPDRMFYQVSAEWERAIGRIFLAGYGRATADMPVDKDQPAAGGVSFGAAVRNQPDFDLLNGPIRFELRAGLDLKYDYDLGLKLGFNTVRPTGWDMGLEVRIEADGRQRLVEGRFFLDTGRDLFFRPFLGIRRMTRPADDPVESRTDGIFEAGVQFLKWFR